MGLSAELASCSNCLQAAGPGAAVAAARWATAEASYLVAVIASQLLPPILWDHYAMLGLLPSPTRARRVAGGRCSSAATAVPPTASRLRSSTRLPRGRARSDARVGIRARQAVDGVTRDGLPEELLDAGRCGARVVAVSAGITGSLTGTSMPAERFLYLAMRSSMDVPG
jgi:hypothetical protein